MRGRSIYIFIDVYKWNVPIENISNDELKLYHDDNTENQ